MVYGEAGKSVSWEGICPFAQKSCPWEYPTCENGPLGKQKGSTRIVLSGNGPDEFEGDLTAPNAWDGDARGLGSHLTVQMQPVVNLTVLDARGKERFDQLAPRAVRAEKLLCGRLRDDWDLSADCVPSSNGGERAF
ncbi:dehydrogenase [Sesbania bispinosa]|nr:dehydrogenase [Sesbania bispinosa]